MARRIAATLVMLASVAGTVLLFVLAGTGNRTEDQMGMLAIGGIFALCLTITVVAFLEDKL